MTAVVGGQSTEAAFTRTDSSAHRAAVRAIALGTVRWYLRLRGAVDRLLARPDSLDPDVHALLVTAAHQIEYSRNAPQKTVHTAVDAVRILRHGHASGLINAVLRKFVAGRDALFAEVDRDDARRTAHPRWLVDALNVAWPHEAASLLEADNVHPPLTLRLNPHRRAPEQYLADLAAAGLRGRVLEGPASPEGPTAVTLEKAVPVAQIPGFQEGWVSVQDAGAQLAAPLLDAAPGMRVLDACAAPGSKAAHILERTEGIELWALDIDAVRLQRVAATLDRLGLAARMVAADVREPAIFWDGRPFERILVDAPCSGTGVIRRHPDIKLLRRSSDIAALAAKQLEILRAAFRLLAPGGRLVYATCSVLPEENEGVMERFYAEAAAAEPVPLQATLVPAGARVTARGLQLLTGGALLNDGFYYACVEKTTAGAR